VARLDNASYVAALRIVQRLQELGHQAYFAGGCVRDLLLGVAPKDFDVATSATPELVMAAFLRTEAVGAHFGVVLVIDHVAEDRTAIEVATFRHDGAYTDGRRPDAVRFSTDPREDVLRRDFTINGLLLDPETDKILDFVEGRRDLEAGIIRAIGDPKRRCMEDKLRMLRAVRFAARFGYQIDPATAEAIKELAPLIVQVSAERLRDELTKILTEGKASRGFEFLDQTGLLQCVLPEVSAMKGVAQPPQHHPEGDVFVHTLLLLEKLPAACPETLAWGVLLHDVGKPPTFTPPAGPNDRIRFNEHEHVGAHISEAMCRRLRFSNEETEQIVALVANHMKFKDVPHMRPAKLKRFVRMDRFDEHLELHRLDCLSSHGSLDNYDFTRRFIAETPPEEVRPARIITGDDLKLLGYRPGPAFRGILEAVEDAQLEGRLADRDQAIRFVQEEFRDRQP
jgi:poly(A) polymerase